jgi:hypothetical protein
MNKYRMAAVALTLGALALTTPLSAQEAGKDPAHGLEAILEVRAADLESDRSAILRFLDRDDVAAIAAERGLDLDHVRSAVQTLSGDDLGSLREDLQSMDDHLAGGNRVVLTSTTIIIILLIIILVAVA